MKPTIRQLKELHTKFCNLYWSSCLISVHNEGIHIDEVGAFDFAPLECWNIKHRTDINYPIEIETVIDGLKLYAVMPMQVAIEMGFVKE